ncbi:MAG: hypothetical protein DWQ31_16575 [Planctomycetota bacterium]|nr:MAG: hypothetical protein DWQ31_16575 [Planctomycetota bacterium]
MSNLKRIQVGESLQGFPANTWNALCDAADNQRLVKGQANPPRPAPTGKNDPRIVNTGSAIDVAHGILMICEPINKPDDRPSAPYEGLHLCGEHPTQQHLDDGLSWVICQEPAKQNRAVPFVAVGQSWVQIDIQDESDTTAGPVAGETDHLVSGEGAATIVWKPTGTGVKMCIVQLGGGGGGAKVRGYLVPSQPGTQAIASIDTSANPIQLIHGAVEAYPLINDGTSAVPGTGYVTPKYKIDLNGPKEVLTHGFLHPIVVPAGMGVLVYALDKLIIAADCVEFELEGTA